MGGVRPSVRVCLHMCACMQALTSLLLTNIVSFQRMKMWGHVDKSGECPLLRTMADSRPAKPENLPQCFMSMSLQHARTSIRACEGVSASSRIIIRLSQLFMDAYKRLE